MKLLERSDRGLVFQLGSREKNLLQSLLQFYPRMPAGHQPLSKSRALPDMESSQRLLEEALAEHRKENRQQLKKLLLDPHRMATNDAGWRLSLSPGDLEWLLQVLNDIRVGSWIKLGSPEGRCDKINEQTAPHLWAMEMALSFQACLLEALSGPEPDRPENKA